MLQQSFFRVGIIFLTGFLLAGIVGCPPGAQEGRVKGKNEKKVIAVIPKGATHNFWKSVEAGVRKAAEENDVEIIWKAPLLEDDRASQIMELENMITRGVDGIAIAPLDAHALKKPIAEAAVNSGIPVILFDSDLDKEGGKKHIGLVATDNFVGGKQAADEMARLLHNKGKVAVLRYQVGSRSTEEREEGFLQQLKQYPEIEVISSEFYAGATIETAKQKAESLINLLAHEDKIDVDGFFAPNESSGQGMLRALETTGFAGKVKFVTFDTADALMSGLLDLKIDALVAQRPVYMGYKTIQLLSKKLRGDEIPEFFDTGSKIITIQNYSEPDTQAIINALKNLDDAVKDFDANPKTGSNDGNNPPSDQMPSDTKEM